MTKLKYSVPVLMLACVIYMSVSCAGQKKLNTEGESDTPPGNYTVYIINNNLHTGIVIPVNSVSAAHISALKYFKNYGFTDIGWGEEKFYQDPEDNFCMGARAILLPNSSVLRVEGYRTTDDISISWSDFAVSLALSEEQFIKLAVFINDSFRKENGDEPVITSKKHSERVIFFKSVYKYHLFNTCNTWVADAVKNAGFDISSFFVITAGQLYSEIKNQGAVLKSLK